MTIEDLNTITLQSQINSQKHLSKYLKSLGTGFHGIKSSNGIIVVYQVNLGAVTTPVIKRTKLIIPANVQIYAMYIGLTEKQKNRM